MNRPFRTRNSKWHYQGFTIAQDWNAQFFIELEGDMRVPVRERYNSLEDAKRVVDNRLAGMGIKQLLPDTTRGQFA
jgi:hypothetical protein